MRKLRFVAAAVLICSWACAGGDAPEPSDNSSGQALAKADPPGATSTRVDLAEDADAQVLGGEEDATTEGSNTNWMPTEPWLDGTERPAMRERPDPRKPSSGQQGNTDAPDQDRPSTMPGQQGASSPSSSSPGSSSSTPGPD